jgi:beta-phosphoglucomutase-like phosphatase (HAD superfamily)
MGKLFPKKNLIVFDIDGTLTDTVPSCTANFIHFIQQLGVNSFDHDFRNYKHHTDSYISKMIYEKATGQPFNESILQEFENPLYENILKEDSISEIKGAKEWVDKIENETDFGVCYATGSLLKTAQYKKQKN